MYLHAVLDMFSSKHLCTYNLLHVPMLHRYIQRLLATGAGLGVHLTLLRSFSFAFCELSHPEVFPITSALREPATPMVVRSRSRLAAGVSVPAASAFRGVQFGGGIDPSPLPLTLEGVLSPSPLPLFMSAALARRLFEALLDNFKPRDSRADGAGI